MKISKSEIQIHLYNDFRRMFEDCEHSTFLSEGKQTPEKGQYLCHWLPFKIDLIGYGEMPARDKQLHPAQQARVKWEIWTFQKGWG